jgi:hypothetical protein
MSVVHGLKVPEPKASWRVEGTVKVTTEYAIDAVVDAFTMRGALGNAASDPGRHGRVVGAPTKTFNFTCRKVDHPEVTP